MSRVVIRCDGTPEGGLGHLVRALSVAEAARGAGWDVVLAGDVTSDLGRDLVSKAGINVVSPDPDLATLVRTYQADVLHLDKYEVGAEAHAQVRGAGAILSSMEDGLFGRRPADVVIDSSVGSEQPGSVSMNRPDDGSVIVLRGVAYAPMRREVLEARAQRRDIAPADDGRDLGVIVVMGGTDVTEASATIAAICRQAAGIGDVTVIAPPERWPAVRAEAGDQVVLTQPGPDFIDRVVQADLVVSAAGTTTWELACIGVPSVIVAVVENQVVGYTSVLEQGVARGLGTLAAVRADRDGARRRLESAVADLRSGRSWAARGLAAVDGRGADRIIEAWRAASELVATESEGDACVHSS